MNTYSGGSNNSIYNSTVSNSLRMTVFINSIPLSGLIDTGSTHTLLKYSKDLKPFMIESEIKFLKVANSEMISVLGKCTKEIQISNIKVPFEFLICSELNIPVIIGMNFLKAHKCVIDLSESEPKLISLDDQIHKNMSSQKIEPSCQYVGNANKITQVSTQIQNSNQSDKNLQKIDLFNDGNLEKFQNSVSRNSTLIDRNLDDINQEVSSAVVGNSTDNSGNSEINENNDDIGRNYATDGRFELNVLDNGTVKENHKKDPKIINTNHGDQNKITHDQKEMLEVQNDDVTQITDHKINDGSHELKDTGKQDQIKQGSDIQIFSKQDYSILPGQIIFIEAYTMCKPDQNKIILVEPSKLAKRINKRLFIVHGVHKLDNDLAIQVLNVTDRKVNISKDKLIAAAKEVEILDLNNFQKDLVKNTQANVNQIVVDDLSWVNDLDFKDTDLDDSQKQKLKDLITKYHSIFSKNKYDIGQIKDYEAEIIVNDEKPIAQAYRPIPYYRREELQNILNELLKAQIISESSSDYCSPIVLVKKKDQSLRLTVDYREINKVVRDVCPTLPQIESSIAKLYKNKFFTSIDLSSAYWQVPLKPESRKYTAFAGNEKLFQFNVLPMGLKISPAIYNRVILHVLQDVAFKSSIVYLDDISILGESFDEHLNNLEAVFQKLQEHGMKIQLAKCNFMKRSLKFLGYKISQKGLETDPAKIECVKSWPTPCNTKALMRFLGFTNFYRKFIPDYAVKSKPLYNLLKKGVLYEWTKSHEQSFQILRQSLIESPILKFANMDISSKNFVLQTDASKYQISAVLLQEAEDGILHPISYASRILKSAENNYCATKLELTAIIFGLQKYRYYLLGRPFEIQCDHKALTFIQSIRKPSPMLARYIEVLSEYNFTISYLKGKHNYLADALSRNVCKIQGCPCSKDQNNIGEVNKMQGIDLPQMSKEEFLEKQLEDPQIVWISEIVQNETNLEDQELKELDKNMRKWYKVKDRLELKDEILVYRDIDQFKQTVFLPVVPKSLVPEILLKFHSNPIVGGHFGIAKTLTKIKQKYFWTTLRKDCIHFCQACSICLKVKPTYTAHRAPLRPIISQEFNQRVQLDITGPFEISSKGNRYCLTIICCFTKFVKCIPVPNITAETVAIALIDHWISVFSVFQILQSDNAQNFRSNLIKELCMILGVQKKFSSPYNPQCQGSIENLNKSLKQYLVKYISQLPDRQTWCEQVALFSLAYNITPHVSTGVEPYVLVFGRKPNFVDDLHISEALTAYDDISDYVRNLQQNILIATEFARDNLEKAKNAQKTTYDKRSKESRLKENQLVLLHRDYKPTTTSSKLEPLYTGPFIISEVLSDLTYKIIDPKQALKPPRIVHRNKLRVIPDTKFDIQRTPQEKFMIQRLKD